MNDTRHTYYSEKKENLVVKGLKPRSNYLESQIIIYIAMLCTTLA